MTEREKNEIRKGYADLIIKKEQLIREIWKTEFGIKKLEDVLIRNKILIPTETEDDWNKNYFDRFLKNLDPEQFIAVVDYHI